MSLILDEQFLSGFVTQSELDAYTGRLAAARERLHTPDGQPKGWRTLPCDTGEELLSAVETAARAIREEADILLVIGIGGSYLGARAVIELLKSPNYNALPKDTPDVYFLGNGISSDALTDVVTMLGDRDFSVNVISKSGTTTEPAIAFRIFKEMLEKKYGKEGARERIFATTDKARGALKTLATQEGYETFVVPDNVGGRYSVLTAVGLLPIACCGIDIVKLMQGAAEERETLLKEGAESAAAEYAMQRQYLYKTGKSIEILAAYEPSFRFMSEWWKQLYGESEGKDKLGIFPASVDLTPDLHSMGQYMQDGLRNLQETVMFFDEARTSVKVPEDADNLDGLNYLAGREMSYINEKAMEATRAAHVEGGVPVTILRLPKITEEAAGALIYFFEFACGVSGYMSGVNPFNQPGVEAYKKNMFHLLGKPGY